MPGLEISDDENGNGSFKNKRKKRTLFSKFDQNNRNDESGDEEANGKAGSGSDGEESFHEQYDEDAPLEIEEENPLLAKFEKESKTSSWFNKVCLIIVALN